MNELIKVNYDNSDRPTVSGRELHALLEINTEYAKWFERMCAYGFSQGIDFSSFVTNTTGGRPSTDHQLTIDMAKQICMIQRSDAGTRCRKYFIEIENQWNNPEAIMARALKIADQKLLEATTKVNMLTEQNKQLDLQNKQQAHEIDQLKPIAAYAQIILNTPGLLTTTQIAKDYGKSAIWLNRMLKGLGVHYSQNGQWLLYAKYASYGYTHTKMVEYTRYDGTKDARPFTMWTQKGRMFIYELLKKNGIVPMIEQS